MSSSALADAPVAARIGRLARASVVAATLGATATLAAEAPSPAAMARAHNPFGDGRSSARIADLLAR